MKFKPHSDNVFVELDSRPEKVGLIHVPGTAIASEFGPSLLVGTVRAAGSGGYGYDVSFVDSHRHKKYKRKWFGVDVVPGDRVIFEKDRGEPADFSGNAVTSPSNETAREFRILRNVEIVGVV